MITTIRNQFKHSTYRYIVFFIVFVLAVGMISLPSLIKNEKSGVSWIARVNGNKISYQDFAQEVAERSEWLAHVRSQYGQYADLLLQAMNIPTDPKALAIEMLIKEDLISQCAKTLGIQLHHGYIAQSMNDQKYAQRNLSNILPSFVFDQSGMLDVDKLKIFLQHKGISIDAFENKIEKALARLQVMRFAETSCYVPSFDIKQEFITTRLGKQFSYITFPFEQFLADAKKQTMSNEDLIAFYTKENSLKRRYWVPEKRNGVMWKFDAKNYNIIISEEEITQYYEDNKVKKYVIDPVKIQVKQITEKQLSLSSDLSLEMVREELMHDTSSQWVQQWELLTPFARGERKGAFEREAFVLQNIGDVSPVIETKDGKVILQLVRRIQRTYKPLHAVKNEIKNILVEKHFKKTFVKDIKSIVSAGDAQAIELFISQKAGKKENVSGITKNDTNVSQELFGLKKGEYAFFVEGETGLVVKLIDIEERNLPEFNSIKEVVREDLCHELAHNTMLSIVQEAKVASSVMSFNDVHKQFGGSLIYTDMIQPTDNKKIQELDEKSLPARSMLNLDKVGLILVHNGEKVSVLIRLDAIESYDENMLIGAQNEIRGGLESQRTKLEVESFVASLHRNATIETNESILIGSEKYSE